MHRVSAPTRGKGEPDYLAYIAEPPKDYKAPRNTLTTKGISPLGEKPRSRFSPWVQSLRDREEAVNRLNEPLPAQKPGFLQRILGRTATAETAAIETATTRPVRNAAVHSTSSHHSRGGNGKLGKLGVALVGVPLVIGGAIAAISWLGNTGRNQPREAWADRVRNEPTENYR